MPLQPQAVSIPLLSLNEKAPRSSGPVGRVQTLFNGEIVKTRDGQIQVQKRSAFRQLTLNGIAVNTGGTGSGGVPSPKLVSSLDGNLFEVSSNAQPNVYDRDAPIWAEWPNRPLLSTLSRASVYAVDAQIVAPDRAAIGNIWCFAWSNINSAAMVKFQDAEGVVIGSPQPLGSFSASERIKVVADGTRFWVFYDSGTTTITVKTFSTLGVNTATATADTLVHAGDSWDVVYDSSVGVCLARPLNTIGARLTVFTFSSGIVASGNNNASIPWSNNTGVNDEGGAFLTSYEADGHVYLFSIFDTDGPVPHVSRLAANATIAHDYTWSDTDITRTTPVCNATGYVIPGSTDIVVSYSLLPTLSSPTQWINSKTKTVSVPASGSPGTVIAARSLQLASRAVRMNGRFYVTAYYPSVPGTNAGSSTAQFSQTTFFMLDLSTDVLSAAKTPVCGRFEYGQAAMDWLFSGWDGTVNIGPGFFRLASFAGARVALGYRAVNFIQERQILIQVDQNTSYLGKPFDAFTSTIGVVDIGFGSPGRAVEYAGELRLPGAMAYNFMGTDFVEDNVNLAPEQPTITSSASTGHLTVGQTYQWVVVWEGTTQTGLRVKSAPCVATSHTMGGSDNTASVVIPTLRATTWTNLIASVYRTYFQNGQMSTLHSKVSNDLSPLYNSTSADTITFTDTVSDSAAAVGEPLYSDALTTPPIGYHYPAPPFSSGCIAANREFVIGYDNALWFSFEKVEGEQISFNSTQRIVLPSNDQMIRVFPLDTRIVILCATSVWAFTLGSLPDVNGNGVIPVPEILPFSNGIAATGAADIIDEGIVYAAETATGVNTTAGPWLITRDLRNTYIGAAVEDELLSATIVDCTVDAQQRIHFFYNINNGASGKDIVYDSVVDQWYVWALPTAPLLCGVLDGNALYADTTHTWVQTPGTYIENGAGISTITTLAPMAFGGVPGLQMVWKLQFLGSAISNHTMTILVTYDDGASIIEEFQFSVGGVNPLVIPSGGAYRWEIDLANPECQAVSVQLQDSFTGTPGAGYTLENIGAEVGILPGAGKLPIAQRISG